MSSSRARRATATDYRVYATGRPRALRADAVAGHFEATGRMYRSPFTERRSSAGDVELLLSTAQMPRRTCTTGLQASHHLRRREASLRPQCEDCFSCLLIPGTADLWGYLWLARISVKSRWLVLLIHTRCILVHTPRMRRPWLFFRLGQNDRCVERALDSSVASIAVM